MLYLCNSILFISILCVSILIMQIMGYHRQLIFQRFRTINFYTYTLSGYISDEYFLRKLQYIPHRFIFLHYHK